MIVVDTNIIAYLLIPGLQTSSAERIYSRDSDWIAPMLWRYELLSALCLYIRKQMLSRHDAVEIMRQARTTVRTSRRLATPQQILEMSEQTGCSSYDCEFVALAMTKQIPLLTADRRLLVKFPGIATSMEAFEKQL